ncbi:hypothetical protein KSS87_007987 [Heliosperma pusillum]|nr:hypothetical protein KSS87_007987 [Heliosperma pusillum]
MHGLTKSQIDGRGLCLQTQFCLASSFMSLWIFYFRQPRSYCKLSRQCRRGFWSVECTSKYGRRQPVTLSGSLMIPTAVTSVALLPLRTLYRGHKRALQVSTAFIRLSNLFPSK